MKQRTLNERYEFIDLLKTIAIFFVVIYHYNNLRSNLLETQDLFTYFNYFSKTIFSAGVPIFFFVNGALLLNKDFNLKRHILKLINLVILTIVWGVITLLILMPIKNEYMSLFEFAKSLWTWKLNWINHLWFLQTLVILYIFFPLIKTTYDNEIKHIYFFLAIAFLLTFGNVFLSNCANTVEFIIGKNYLKGNFNFFNNFNAFSGIYGYSFVYFILGGIFLRYRDKLHRKNATPIAISLIIVSMAISTLYGILMTRSNKELYDIVWNGYDSIPTLLIVVALFILSLKYNGEYKISKVINCIGQNSLGIFLTHRIWGVLFIEHFEKFSHSQNLITNFMFSIIIILISLISVLLLKRIPIVKKLFII